MDLIFGKIIFKNETSALSTSGSLDKKKLRLNKIENVPKSKNTKENCTKFYKR